MRQVAHLLERLGSHHGADGEGSGGVEHLARLIGRQECIDLFLGGKVHPLSGVGEDEPVHADHHGDGDLLGEAKGLDVQVGSLLDCLPAQQLDPAGVARCGGVAVVVPDVDGGADGAVGQRHDDGKPEPAGVVDGLHHEQQPLTGLWW